MSEFSKAIEVKYDSSTSTYNLNNFSIDLKQTYRIKEFKIVDLVLPNLFYNITSANNELTTSDGTITIDAGFWNITDLTTEIEDKLQVLNANYTATYDSSTYKITISKNSNFSITSGSLKNPIGFTASSYTGNSNYTGNIVNLRTLNELYLECNQFGIPTNINGQTRNLLTKIPLNVSLGEVMSLTSDDVYTLNREVSFNALDIRLTTYDNILVSTYPNVSFSFLILFN